MDNKSLQWRQVLAGVKTVVKGALSPFHGLLALLPHLPGYSLFSSNATLFFLQRFFERRLHTFSISTPFDRTVYFFFSNFEKN